MQTKFSLLFPKKVMLPPPPIFKFEFYFETFFLGTSSKIKTEYLEPSHLLTFRYHKDLLNYSFETSIRQKKVALHKKMWW